MTPRRCTYPFPASLLHVAALLVPSRHRAEWLAEWQAELWHVCRTYGASEKVIAFCLGAFQDGFWLRHERERLRLNRLSEPGTATRCGLVLALFAVASFLACVSLPCPRQAVLPAQHRNFDDLLFVSRQGYFGAQSPTVSLDDYRSLTMSTRHLFAHLAFYQPVQSQIDYPTHQSSMLLVARASDTLPDLLGLSISSSVMPQAHRTQEAMLILSQKAWRQHFGADPHVVGQTVNVDGQRAWVGDIAPVKTWSLPGEVDALLVLDRKQLALLPLSSMGFVLADREPAWVFAQAAPSRLFIERDSGAGDYFECLRLSERRENPFGIFLFTLLLACLALPATTSLPLGEYPVVHGPLRTGLRFRRWLFLVMKVALILPLVHCSAIVLAYVHLPVASRSAEYTQFLVSFLGMLFAFRWALQDQRKRCPLCLRMLTHAAHVGHPSHSFLAWNGTEMICSGGHGLLYIPALPTSWFGTQRWLYLDPSWSSLFPYAESA